MNKIIKYLGFYPLFIFMLSFLFDNDIALVLRWSSLGYYVGWFAFKNRLKYISKNGLNYLTFAILNDLQNDIHNSIFKIQSSGRNKSFIFNVLYKGKILFQILHGRNFLTEPRLSLFISLPITDNILQKELLQFFQRKSNVEVYDDNKMKYALVKFDVNINLLMSEIVEFIELYKLEVKEITYVKDEDKTIFNN